MKANVYYSSLIVFMMSVTLVVVTSDKSVVEKIVSPILPHGASIQQESSIMRTFQVSSVASAWNITSCEKANRAIHEKPLNELELMSKEQLSDFVNQANALC